MPPYFSEKLPKGCCFSDMDLIRFIAYFVILFFVFGPCVKRMTDSLACFTSLYLSFFFRLKQSSELVLSVQNATVENLETEPEPQQ